MHSEKLHALAHRLLDAAAGRSGHDTPSPLIYGGHTQGPCLLTLFPAFSRSRSPNIIHLLSPSMFELSGRCGVAGEQLFLKAPMCGSEKPFHQDNFYFR